MKYKIILFFNYFNHKKLLKSLGNGAYYSVALITYYEQEKMGFISLSNTNFITPINNTKQFEFFFIVYSNWCSFKTKENVYEPYFIKYFFYLHKNKKIMKKFPIFNKIKFLKKKI